MITTGIDADGNVYAANDFNCPRTVMCPVCGALMYLTTSALGNPYFACFPGRHHLHAECHRVAENPNLILPYLTYSDKFFQYMFRPGIDGSAAGVGGGGGSARSGRDITEHVVPIRTLIDLVGNGFLDYNNIKIGDGWLSDIIINPKYAYMLLGCPDIGERVLVARPDYSFSWSNTIRFVLFIATDIQNHPIHKLITLDVCVKDRDMYLKLHKKLFREVADEASSGKTKLVSNYRQVLIAGKWMKRDPDMNYRKNGSWGCEGYLFTTLERMSCIYAPLKERYDMKAVPDSK